MSTTISAACWKLGGLTPTQKLVLISLADQANDDGVCWPSTAAMEVRTCLSERAIRGALRSLEEIGLLKTHHREGRSSWFTVTPAGNAGVPRQQVPPTPAAGAGVPRQQVPPTPAAGAPITVIEPSVEPPLKRSAYRAEDESLPTALPRDLWVKWCAYRRTIRKPIKPDTARLQLAFLAQAILDGRSAEEIIDTSIRSGWTGLFLPKGAQAQAGARERAARNNADFLNVIGGQP